MITTWRICSKAMFTLITFKHSCLAFRLVLHLRQCSWFLSFTAVFTVNYFGI